MFKALSTSLLLCALCASAAPKPNVIIIFTDDQGYGDLGCYGAEGFTTPAIDRMAEEGIRFTDFTVANTICTPSRAALLTGRYPERWGYEKGVFFPHSNVGMPSEEITIAELLKDAGYRTALVGKWHLGHKQPYLPTNQGFDYYFGIPYSNDMWQDGREPVAEGMVFNEGMTLEDYLSCDGHKKVKKGFKFRNMVPLMRDTEVIEWPVDQSQITARYTAEAQTFIKDNKDQPFFLYLAHSMPHTPLFASEGFAGKTTRGLYGDVIEEIDWSVGEILNTVREQGLAENTLIIFTSDNGPWLVKGKDGGSQGDLYGGKGTTYEGGQRVPCVMWWPKTIPAGQVEDTHVTALDLLPTIAAFTDATVPDDRAIDGLDMHEFLQGNPSKAPERDFFLYARGEAIRIGDWKYRHGPAGINPYKKSEDSYVTQLFNLKDDPNETQNLAEKYPERTAAMAERLATEHAKILKQ